ncbi:GNAT family N-acetyltransferase [Chelativorans sp. ZYF759]|uniref:GNAT family N-acetyltransferase n=1 Tax=Chelativorans sp. ZYF759 TaxID=2692213 RepID=UPI00145D694C|nr:GNAT family N-acetyltransferase [Chelativorans sp. ZYF759]NMG40536.1 GNAT family N-acetyltransferase [Chelativorans sp. ZYF759]
MLRIEKVRQDDLSTTATLHRQHLELGLFPQLGERFMRAYHASFAASPHAIALVARSESGRVVGALFGTTANARHYRWVVEEHGMNLAVQGTRSLLLQPALAWSFISSRAGRYAKGLGRHLGLLGRDDAAVANAGAGPSCVLSHIVTSKAARRLGVGRRLVEEFRRQAHATGAAEARLVTREGGPGAPFFERLGCACVDLRPSQDGEALREYSLQLDKTIADEKPDAARRLRHERRAARPGFRHGWGESAGAGLRAG